MNARTIEPFGTSVLACWRQLMSQERIGLQEESDGTGRDKPFGADSQ
jgi:hypothetical protein